MLVLTEQSINIELPGNSITPELLMQLLLAGSLHTVLLAGKFVYFSRRLDY